MFIVLLRLFRDEFYGLTSQIRRAAVSIGANIAEGAGNNSRAELARFLQIALGSGSELEYHFLLSRDLGYLVLRPSNSFHYRWPKPRRCWAASCSILGLACGKQELMADG
jgi:four helix bundle protein